MLITIVFNDMVWALLGLMFMGAAIILFFIYFEQRWVKREYLQTGLWATIVLAIAYGVYEYIFFDAGWNKFFHLADWFVAVFGDKYYYWGFMTILNFSVVFLFSRKSIALSIAAIPLFAVNEDLWYWITKSIHELRYVFPVGNWFDTRFPFLHGLGEPLTGFTEFPRFYFVGWILVSILLFIQFRNLHDRAFLIALTAFTAASFFCVFLAIL
ncbi:MAG: hypothetical protein ACTSRS_04125 [Candidatus Helarchaeota archaeon]